jgi:hypothetical protein
LSIPSVQLPLPGTPSVTGVPATTLQVVPVPAVAHTRVPDRWQKPVPTVQGDPRSAKPSSMSPSTSSSKPLHSSSDRHVSSA